MLASAALLLLVYRKFGRSDMFAGPFRPSMLTGHPKLSVYADMYWFVFGFLGLGVLPAVVFSRRRWRIPSMGLGLGDVRFGLCVVACLYLFMALVVMAVSRTPAFHNYYPLNALLRHEAGVFLARSRSAPETFWVHLLVYEALYGLYFVGWEFFFRGFLSIGLYNRFGFHSVLIANIPFVVLHSGKPLLEGLGSTFAGIALGWLAIRTRSFWYGAILHAAVAWTMDGLSIYARLVLQKAT
jgi:uncharacterized protein